MRHALVLAVLGLALACATPPAGGPTGPAASAPPAAEKLAVRTSAEGFRVPEEVGEFRLERLADLEPAEAGFLARYEGPNEQIDFFVYSARNLPREVSVANALWREYEHLKHDIDAAAPQRDWKIALAREEIMRAETADGDVDGVLATYQGETKDGEPIRSLGYLALLRTDFVKMRATQRGAVSAQTDAVDAARREFYAKLAPRAERTTLEFDSEFTVTSLDLDSMCSVFSEAVITTVLEQMLNQGVTLHTLERAVALIEAALSYGELVDKKCTEPTLRDLAATQQAGFLREYAWTAMRASFWPDPGDLRLEEFAAFRRKKLKSPFATHDFGVNLQFKELGALPPPSDTP